MSGRWIGYAWAVAAALACTLAGWAMSPRFDLVNIAMVYLLGVVLVALRFSRGPAILASALSVAAFDVLFVPPRGALTVDDVQYLLTFAIMLAVGLVISTPRRARAPPRAARRRRWRSRPRPSASAPRCWPRSRTTCARRSP